MFKYCTNCDSKMPADNLFCTNCGMKFNQENNYNVNPQNNFRLCHNKWLILTRNSV